MSFLRDRTRIINSRGNIWEKAAGNIQLAIEDVLLDEGDALWLPKGKTTETSGWVVDEEKPVHVFGAGMCWHDLNKGTKVQRPELRPLRGLRPGHHPLRRPLRHDPLPRLRS
jgi:hypothetical protein